MKKLNALNAISLESWPLIAMKSGYRVGVLAKLLGVSTRSLHNYFSHRFSTSPRKLLAMWRMQAIDEHTKQRMVAKEYISKLGISHTSSLSRIRTRDGKANLMNRSSQK